MPPEPFPWDRRDFRKHERSVPEPRFGGSGPPRWREQNHPRAPPPHAPPYHHQQQQQRWYSDFRSRPLPPGHGGKQGGWHMYPDEPGHGFLPYGSRFNDRNLEDGNFRPFGSYNEGGRFIRNSRDNNRGGPFSQRNWKSTSRDDTRENNKGSFSHKGLRATSREPIASPRVPSRPHTELNESEKPIENIQTHPNKISIINNNSKSNESSHPPPDPVVLSEQPQSPSEEQQENNNHSGECDKLVNTEEKPEKENRLGSTDWKHMKWSRSGSLSSSSSKSMGFNSIETVPEIQTTTVKPVRSPAPSSSGEASSRKKLRLGWGEGLAKFEKKKDNDPEENDTVKDGLVVSVDNAENGVNVLDRSPRVGGLIECASPATPSSVACSSSPGVEEKLSLKAVNVDHDVANFSSPPSIMSTPFEGPTFNLENLDLTSVASVSSLINELVQSDDPKNSGYVGPTSMNKLLLWKGDILKAIEVAESEIDSLETELKSSTSEPRYLEEQNTSSNFTPRPSSLQILKNTLVHVEDEHVESKDEDIDSPGSATSKYVQVSPSGAATVDEENAVPVTDVYSDVHSINDSILASNKESANEAVGVFDKFLPANQSPVSCLLSEPLTVKKLIMRKRFIQFKEKVITVKFKTFQHFWREGRLVAVKKLRARSHKKLDLTVQKKNAHNRSRNSLAAGNSQTVPAAEVIEFVNTLLSDSPIRPCRNTLKMPALILGKEMESRRFISNNGLVEDPCAVEKERSMLNSWTNEEREIFIDKLTTLGKDFSKIASFLDHKTTADCVEFYYKNHKSDCFEKARKKSKQKSKQSQSQSTTYLVASGKRWNSAASLDILGAASEIAANEENSSRVHEKYLSRFGVGAPPRHDDGPSHESNGLDLLSNSEREAVAADVLAGICGSLSSEAMGSCITGSFDQRVNSSRKRPLTPEVADECSDESCGGEVGPIPWTDGEKSVFLQAVSSYGKDFEMISQCVGTRSADQCKSFFIKGRKCLGLDLILPGNEGDNSDAEGDSVVENEGCGCKIDEDFSPPVVKSSHVSDVTPGTQIIEGHNGSDLEEMPVEKLLSNDDEPVLDVDLNVEEGQNGPEGTGILTSIPESVIRVEESNIEAAEVSNKVEEENNKKVVTDSDSPHSSVQVDNNIPKRQKKATSYESFLARKSRPVPMQQDAHLASSKLFSVPIMYQEISNPKYVPPAGAAGDFQPNFPSLSDRVESSSQILRGYPVSDQQTKFFPLQKCNGSRNQHNAEHSRNRSEVEKPSRNGGVKLFGQILESSSDPKPNSSGQEQLTGHYTHKSVPVNPSSQSNLDGTSYLGSKNIPVRNFPFWGGKTIQTGLPPVPDSALLLSKYPAAFSNYSMPGVNVFPTGGSVVHHIPQNQETLFSEMQRMNGYDVVSGIQQQSRSTVGIRGGVSDPVEAMKLHYAKVGNLSGKIIKEDDRKGGT